MRCPWKEKQVLLGLLTGSWFGQGGKRKAQETSQGKMSQGSHLGLVAGAVVA